MDKEECIARLHLLGFETNNKTPKSIIIKPGANLKFTFIFAHKQKFIGYITASNGYSIPNYFTRYEQMIDKALELNEYDKI